MSERADAGALDHPLAGRRGFPRHPPSLPIALVLAAIALFRAASWNDAYAWPSGFVALNLFFIAGAGLTAAVALARQFLAQPRAQLLLLASGSLVWGCGGLIASLPSLMPALPLHANAHITLYNLSVWWAAMILLGGALTRTERRLAPARRWLAGAFACALLGVALVWQLALHDALPAFFIPGEGGTLVRHFVLGSAVVLLVLSARVLVHSGPAHPFLHWFAHGCLLIAAGLLAVMLMSVADSPLNWLGRSAQYLGGAYLFVAVRALRNRDGDAPATLQWESESQWLRYGVAIALAIAAAALRFAFLGDLLNGYPFVTFFPAVAVAAMFGGFGPGMLAAGVSSWLAHLFWQSDAGSANLVALGAFIASCAVIAWSAHLLQRMQAKARAAEMAQQDFLGALVESMPQFVWTARPDGSIDFVGPQWARYTGSSEAEALGRGWLEQIHAEDRPVAIQAMEDAIVRGEPFDAELRIRGADGIHRWFKARVVPARDAQGAVTRWIGSGTEIDHLRRAERALAQHRDHLEELVATRTLALEREIAEHREAEERLRQTLEALNIERDKLAAVIGTLPVAIRIADARGKTLLMNEAGLELFGFDSGTEMLGELAEYQERFEVRRLDGTMLPIEQWPAVRAMRGDFVGGEELLLRNRAAGIERIVSYTIVPVRGSAGEVLLLVIVMHDVTQRRHDETALQRANAQLREADRRKDEFLASLAHELRNPLAPLRNALRIMRLAPDDAVRREQAQGMMERQVAQLVRLVEDLLDLSRIVTGKLRLRHEMLDLRDIVHSAVESAEGLVRSREHRLEVDLPPQALVLEGDPARLTQVVSNLLTNAAKYTDPRGRICVAATREGGQAVVRVRDTGIGIAREKLDFIFEMFAQVHGPRGHGSDGLGIGLNLVRRLVELHGGAVSARSEGLNMGSEFVVRLPLAQPAAEELQPPPAVPSLGRKARLKVLVVDDAVDAADSLAMLLGMQGHEVMTRHDGMSGVAAAVEFRPDLVILDLGMPRMDGYAAAREIHSRLGDRDRPYLVALTGWGQEDDRRRSREAGFDHHLTKPAESEDLDRVLQTCTATRPQGRLRESPAPPD